MSNLIANLVRVCLHLLPDSVVEEINRRSLDELDERGLIIWADEGCEKN
ncbi:hypothetical protein [Coleofasciculus sp. H7-2]